jgi:hypothetical protein
LEFPVDGFSSFQSGHRQRDLMHFVEMKAVGFPMNSAVLNLSGKLLQ